eukprot:scaffold4251_cov430-Prasinococcus_capsulatus_cf.AAC.5
MPRLGGCTVTLRCLWPERVHGRGGARAPRNSFFAKRYRCDLVPGGQSESWLAAFLLTRNLGAPHRHPLHLRDDIPPAIFSLGPLAARESGEPPAPS